MTNKAATTPTNSNGIPNIKAKIGTQIAAIIEASDTYLLIITITSQMIKTIADTVGMSMIMTPRPVATPLPPLNFKNKDSECPMIATIQILKIKIVNVQ